MRRELNTCSSQSAMHHAVRVHVFFRRSTTAETAAAAAHLESRRTFFRIRTRNDSVTTSIIAFAREIEDKKAPSRTRSILQ